jgi:hypothetical protein
MFYLKNGLNIGRPTHLKFLRKTHLLLLLLLLLLLYIEKLYALFF